MVSEVATVRPYSVFALAAAAGFLTFACVKNPAGIQHAVAVSVKFWPERVRAGFCEGIRVQRLKSRYSVNNQLCSRNIVAVEHGAAVRIAVEVVGRAIKPFA